MLYCPPPLPQPSAPKVCRLCWTWPPTPTSPVPPSFFKKNGHCGFKKLNCPLGRAERRDWWGPPVVPLETSWKQEPLLLAVCGSSQSVWLPFRKVALWAQHGTTRELCEQRAENMFECDICSFREKQWLLLPTDSVLSYKFMESLFFYELTFTGVFVFQYGEHLLVSIYSVHM